MNQPPPLPTKKDERSQKAQNNSKTNRKTGTVFSKLSKGSKHFSLKQSIDEEIKFYDFLLMFSSIELATLLIATSIFLNRGYWNHFNVLLLSWVILLLIVVIIIFFRGNIKKYLKVTLHIYSKKDRTINQKSYKEFKRKIYHNRLNEKNINVFYLKEIIAFSKTNLPILIKSLLVLGNLLYIFFLYLNFN